MVLENGNIRCTLACAGCVKRGIILTTPTPTPTPTLTKAPLDAEERDVRGVLRKLARHLRGLAKGQKQMDAEFTAEGLEQSADIADAWAARPQVRR